MKKKDVLGPIGLKKRSHTKKSLNITSLLGQHAVMLTKLFLKREIQILFFVILQFFFAFQNQQKTVLR